jgi:signal transduction histidine kinase/FixJ family two-component response regulator
MKYSVQLGFGVIIFLIIVSSSGVLYQTHYANSIVNELVSVSNAKIEYAQTMRNAIQYRVISLNRMLTLEDPFVRDKEAMRFYAYASPYIQARNKLRALPMTDKEQVVHQRIRKYALTSQPLSHRVLDLIMLDAPKDTIYQVLNAAAEQRTPLYEALDELVALQKQYAQAALTKSRELSNEIFWAIIILSLLVISVSLSVATYVSHVVARKNRQLIDKNTELEIAYDKAEAATKSKSAFLANMSHEIRTPITAIIGFAEASLLSNQTMQMRQQALNMIIKSSQHLLQIINDILDLSKIDADKLNIEQVTISLIELVDEVGMIVQPLAEEKGLKFSVNKHYPLPMEIMADPLRLKQILLNLCSNAIKFTRHGHVMINLKYGNSSKQLVIEVNDSGIGLEQNQIKRIFDDFSQADSSISRRFGGTGLGLSLSKKLANAMSADLVVESEKDKGSTFRLTFNTVAEKLVYGDEQSTREEIQSPLSQYEGQRLTGKVLVVEDNQVNQQLLRMFLEKIDVDITIVENGKEAVERALSEHFDLILMDIQMPVMDGVEATKMLRDNDYKKPIVALTANIMKEDVDNYYSVGCDEFLAKPIDSQKFYQVVGSYLKLQPANAPEDSDPIKSEVIEQDSRLLAVATNYLRHYLPDTILGIREHIAKRDWEGLGNILTQVKGSSGSLGYIELREVILKMEFQVLNKNQAELNKLVEELDDVYARMRAGLNIVVTDNQQPGQATQ